MASFGFIIHHERPAAHELARDAAAWLLDRGHELRLPQRDATVAGLAELGCPDEKLAHGLDVAISIGGDGTMLRTVDLVAADNVPVIGINVGQLGYLTEVEPQGMRMALKRFLSGAYEIEERMLIEVAVQSRTVDLDGPRLALNEAVLEKTPRGHTVRLGVSIDGEFFTGSTAYSFSARGPIVAPTHRCLLLTPVSPHMLFDRSLVLDPSALVRIEVQGHRPATLSVDGRNLGTLEEGDSFTCTAAPGSARFVMFGHRDFLRILKSKFGLADR
jgi:NAD+ kinase